ncbi:hypothetical protein OG609_43785 [Streptomyces sp. NBC_01224]|uniref:hypothetical protein n=1 Tax=Streptomyces sp. NBC_01224 TaxID=2903783 RepID=UPI002E12A2A7|nr:hypothetical protein OG609_43785 [Streptomyces sp. NBC_01224]
MSDVLAWNVAVSLDRILPTEILGPVVEGAVLNNFAEAVELAGDVAEPGEEKEGKDWWHLYLTPPVATMLDWYIRHHPSPAHWYIGEIMHEPRTRWNVPPKETLRTLRQALALDGELTDEQRATYFALLSPREDID